MLIVDTRCSQKTAFSDLTALPLCPEGACPTKWRSDIAATSIHQSELPGLIFATCRFCDELRLSVPKISLDEAGIGENGGSGKLRKLLINEQNDQLQPTCYQTENPCVGGSIPPLATRFLLSKQCHAAAFLRGFWLSSTTGVPKTCPNVRPYAPHAALNARR